MAYHLILDSGHNEYVAGKRSQDGKFLEWVFNNNMQIKIKKRAEQHGIKVCLTNPSPAKKDEIGLSKRVSISNNYYNNTAKKKNCIFISLHGNAFSDANTRGTETYGYVNSCSVTKSVAKYVNDEIYAVFKSKDSAAKNRGVKYSNFTVLSCVAPAILIEYGFYTNAKDRLIMEKYENELTEATIKGICKQFSLKYLAPTTTPPTPPSTGGTTYFRVIAGSYLQRKDAEAAQTKCKSHGWKDTFLAAFDKDGKTYLRVIVASDPNRDKANAELAKLKKYFPDAFLGTYVKQ